MPIAFTVSRIPSRPGRAMADADGRRSASGDKPISHFGPPRACVPEQRVVNEVNLKNKSRLWCVHRRTHGRVKWRILHPATPAQSSADYSST